MKITKEMLEKKGACAPDVKRFDRMFPKGMVITIANCEKIVTGRCSKLDGRFVTRKSMLIEGRWLWFSNEFLTKKDCFNLLIVDANWFVGGLTKKQYREQAGRILYDACKRKWGKK